MDKFQENQWENNEIDKNKLRHRLSDARWRANLANCYSDLKKLLGNEDVLHRRKATKAVVLKEMIQHILCMENTLEKLLQKKANHEGFESEHIPEKYTLTYYKNEFKKQEENRKTIRNNIRKVSLRNNRNKFKKNSSSVLILKSLQNCKNEIINTTPRNNFPLLREKYSVEDHCYSTISSTMTENQELSSFLDNWEDLQECELNANEKKDQFIAETKFNKINHNKSNTINKITNKKYTLNNLKSTSEVFVKNALKDTSPKNRIIENFSTPINRFWSDRNLFSCPATPVTSPYKRSPYADKIGFQSYSEPKRRRKYLTEVRRNILEKIEISDDETNCIDKMHHSFENKSQLTKIEKNSSINVKESVSQNSHRNQFKENLHKPIKISVRRGLENLMNNIDSKNKAEDDSKIMFSQSQEPDISFTKLIPQENFTQNSSAIYLKYKTKYTKKEQPNESLFKNELNIVTGTKHIDIHQISNLQNEEKEKEREFSIQNFKQEELFETPPNLLNNAFDSEHFIISPKTWSNIVSPLSINKEDKENNSQQDIIVKFNDLFANNKFDPELFFDKWYKSTYMDCIDTSESSVLQETKQNYGIDQDETTFEYLSNYMKQIDLLNLEETCQEVPTNFSLQCNISENNKVPEKLSDYSSIIANNSNLNDKITFEDQEVPEQDKCSIKDANFLKFSSTDNATFIPFQKMENNSNLIYEVPDINTTPQSNFSKVLEQNLKNEELNKQENIHKKNNVCDNSHNYLIQEQDPILTSANFSINQLKLTGSKQPNSFWHSPKNQSNPNFQHNDCFWSPCKDFSSIALFDI